jgi:hypothetical protein
VNREGDRTVATIPFRLSTNALVFRAICAGPRPTIRKITRDQTFQKFDENKGVDAALLFDHEAHVNQTHPVTGACHLDNRRFTFFTPGAAGVMIGPDVRGVPKIDLY